MARKSPQLAALVCGLSGVLAPTAAYAQPARSQDQEITNWYPFDRREVHINAQGIYLHHSPVGGPSYPCIVGGNDWLWNTDFIVTF